MGSSALSAADAAKRRCSEKLEYYLKKAAQRGWAAMLSRIGELLRERQISLRRPPVDEHIHDPAAGADFALIEVAGQVDLGQPRRAAFFK